MKNSLSLYFAFVITLITSTSYANLSINKLINFDVTKNKTNYAKSLNTDDKLTLTFNSNYSFGQTIWNGYKSSPICNQWEHDYVDGHDFCTDETQSWLPSFIITNYHHLVEITLNGRKQDYNKSQSHLNSFTIPDICVANIESYRLTQNEKPIVAPKEISINKNCSLYMGYESGLTHFMSNSEVYYAVDYSFSANASFNETQNIKFINGRNTNTKASPTLIKLNEKYSDISSSNLSVTGFVKLPAGGKYDHDFIFEPATLTQSLF